MTLEKVSQVRFHAGVLYNRSVYTSLNAQKHDVTILLQENGVRILPNHPTEFATPKFIFAANILEVDLYPQERQEVLPIPIKKSGGGRWPQKDPPPDAA